MGGQIDLWVDITSPASYFAYVYLQRQLGLLKSYGVDVNFHSMFIGAVVIGSKNKSPFEIPAKRSYNPIDFERHAKYFDIPYAGFPDYMPASSALPQRCLYYIEEKHPQQHVAIWLALFEAFWARNMNVTKPDILETLLREHFSDASVIREILAAGKEQKYKDALQAETKTCMEKGAFGAPWFIVKNDAGQEAPFWGCDRFHLIFEHLELPVQRMKVLEKASL